MPATDNNEIRTRPCPNCYLCGSKGEVLYQGLSDRLFDAPGKWSLSRCPNKECGLIWLNPMPVEEDIGGAYYNYYTHQISNASSSSNLVSFFRVNLRRAFKFLLRLTPLHGERKRLNFMYLHGVQPGKLLEIGCGNGERLLLMHSLGWIVEGQEIDFRAIAHARDSNGIKIHLGRIEKINFTHAFDALIMNHVIEHVYDPLSLLMDCRRILKPGGILVAVTPNSDSYGHKQFKESLFSLDPPRHLHFFNQRTLQSLALKSGFAQYKTWTTAANAQVVTAASLNIQHDGRHDMTKFPKLSREIFSMYSQLKARTIFTLDKNSGEECILKAVK